jgi:plastocyanin
VFDSSARRRSFARRGLLVSLGGLVSSSLFTKVVAAQEATPEWTPPEIPQPLPNPEGTPPPIVGAQPAAGAPVSGAPTSIEQPSAAGTPGVGEGTPTTGGEAPVTNPQQPAQPLATPVVDEQEAAPAVTVIITPDFQFDPEEVRIRVGEAVEWRNEGRAPQTVTDNPAWAGDDSSVVLPEGAEPWDAGIVNFGDSVTHVFDVPGEYVYVSLPQEANGMTGRVIVEP